MTDREKFRQTALRVHSQLKWKLILGFSFLMIPFYGINILGEFFKSGTWSGISPEHLFVYMLVVLTLLFWLILRAFLLAPIEDINNMVDAINALYEAEEKGTLESKEPEIKSSELEVWEL